MSKLYVRAQYSKTNEETIEMTGHINTKSLSFVSDNKKTFKIKKTFKRYLYQDKIIIASDEGKVEEEWIITMIPTKKILESMEVKDMDIDEEENGEENEEESDEEESDEEESDEEESSEDDDDYTPKKNNEEDEYLEEEEEYSDEDGY